VPEFFTDSRRGAADTDEFRRARLESRRDDGPYMVEVVGGEPMPDNFPPPAETELKPCR
jgi:hypothetical protein